MAADAMVTRCRQALQWRAPPGGRSDHNRDDRAQPSWPDRRRALCALVGSCLLRPAGAQGSGGVFDHSHADWDALLRRHVVWNPAGTASSVDYRALALARAELRRVLDAFSAVERGHYERFSRDERLAFLINAYNAFTLELILTRYPELKSIRDLGSLLQSPWKRRFFRLLGEERHLDAVEHDLIRAPGVFDEPRIHFAVVCASIGCPALRPEAFTAARLPVQLEDSTRRFLRDRTRNRFNARAARLEVSRIFEWYRADFEKRLRGAGSLEAYFAGQAELLSDDPREQQLIRGQRQPIASLDYDWSLNDRR